MTPQADYPEVGSRVRMVQTGSWVHVKERKAEGGQGVLYRGRTEQGAELAVKWYRPSRLAARQRRHIAGLASYARPHPNFTWPIDLVEAAGVSSFGYVMPWVPERFGSLVELLKRPDPLPFRTVITIARQLVDSFNALHGIGMCYRDISFGNLLVDAERGDVAIVDNDNCGTEDGEIFVKGTLRFMAPEIIRDEAKPSTVSDLHSLAVFLFYLFVHGHPLEGRRVHSSYTWGERGNLSETALVVRFFGAEPLFVFDPDDSSNAPEIDDPMLRWWPIYPRFFQSLFRRAFGPGLTDASLSGRVTESEWRRALIRLGDRLGGCRCTAAVFWDEEEPGRRCWHCGTVPPTPPTLRVKDRTVVLAEGTVLGGDLFGANGHATPEGVVERHPTQPGEVVIRNVGQGEWAVAPQGEERKVVRPGQRLGVRPMAITFGSIRGTIGSASGV